MSKPSISVFFPFLNDWGTVGSLVSLTVSTLNKLTDDWEIIIVDDGSQLKDRMALELIIEVINNSGRISKIKDQISKTNIKNQILKNRIKIIHHEKNTGYGGALREGFRQATKDLVFYTDCDAQYDPRELEDLYKALKPDVDMVNGYKIKRHDPLHRIIAGRIYHYFVKFVFQLPIKDTDCDFRLIRREVFKKVNLFESTGTICTELVKKIDHAGYKIAEVPVHHYWRTSGKSQFFNFKRLYNTAVNLGKLWWKLIILRNYYE